MKVTKSKRSISAVTQGRLFGERGVSERFHLEESTGLIIRTVIRRNESLGPVVTDLGLWDKRVPLDDLRAAADLAFLQRASAPTPPEDGEEVRFVDLFSGCGAMSLGVQEACRAVGMRAVPLGGFDIQPRIAEVYARNFGSSEPRTSDLAEVLAPELESPFSESELTLRDSLQRVDLVCAGPPCQGHSNLNNKTRRNDPKNALYFLVARFAQLVRPRWIIVENVIAVLHDRGQVVQRTQAALEELGYEVTSGIIDLWNLGVAQTRRRHVLVAQRKDDPASVVGTLPYLEDLIASHMTRHRPLSWAIADLLHVESESFMDRWRVPDTVTQSRIDYLFDHDLYDLPKSQRPESHKGAHGDSYKAVYGRMRWEEPAPTLTSGFLTMGQGRFVHPKRRRTITVHEATRIQFIPDFFDFSSISDSRALLTETIGNAVPPKLSYVVALELLR